MLLFHTDTKISLWIKVNADFLILHPYILWHSISSFPATKPKTVFINRNYLFICRLNRKIINLNTVSLVAHFTPKHDQKTKKKMMKESTTTDAVLRVMRRENRKKERKIIYECQSIWFSVVFFFLSYFSLFGVHFACFMYIHVIQ